MKCFNCGRNIEDESTVCPWCKKEQGISRELFDATKARSQQARADVYNLCYENVYFTVKSMVKDEDTIQEIVQETFIQAFHSMDWMEFEEGRFQAWIRRVAHSTTVSYIRKKKPILFSKMETDDQEYGSDFTDERQENLPEAVIDRDETARLIQEIMDTLSEEQQLAVGMYYYEQKSVREIAQTMGLSESIIKSRLGQARKKIKEKVEELGRNGTKLYGLFPIPFLLLLFRNQAEQASKTPNEHTLQLIQQAFPATAEAAKAGAVADEAAKADMAAAEVGVATKEAGTAQEKAGAAQEEVTAAQEEENAVQEEVSDAAESEDSSDTAEESDDQGGRIKGIGWKIAVGLVVIGLVCGLITYLVSKSNTADNTVASLTTESELSSETVTETEPETETVSESETIMEEVIEPNAMIADVPDWETEEQTVLGNANLLRSEVSSITFLSDADELTDYAEDMVWDVSEAQDGSVMAYALENEDAGYELYIVSDSGVYANANSSYMFAYYSSVTTITFNGLFHTEQVTDMSGLFSDDSLLEQIDLTGLVTANVTDMNNMFYGCAALENLDLTGFDTSNVTDMNSMFCGCTSLQAVDVSLWNTAAVTDMCYMFQACESLSELDLSGFNTMGVENMTYMFEGCTELGALDLSSFQTGSVIDMSYMFEACYALVTLDVSNFDTANVTDMSYMFEGCEVLESLDLSSFDTSEVLSMAGMFEACAALEELDVSNFDTANVENMEYMFSGCSLLTTLDVSGFSTGNVGNMNGMFSWCESLTTLDVSNFDTSNVGDMSEMFYNCTSLSIDLSSFDMTNIYNMDNMTEGCLSVTGL